MSWGGIPASAIESHDSVVRLNQAPADSSLKGSGSGNKHTQTKDVGERSNFRALSKPWIHKYSLPEKGGLSPQICRWSGVRI